MTGMRAGGLRKYRVVVILVSLLFLANSSPVRSSEGVSWIGGPIDREEDCLEPRPESLSLAGVTDNGNDVKVEVLVLLDGVSKKHGKEVMDLAAKSYVPLSITLVTGFKKVALAGNTAGGRIVGQEAVDQAKALLSGSRPKGIDVVYVMTAKNLDAAAGFADCIGGVRYPSRAFAVGEDWNYPEEEVPVGDYEDLTAKIAAHEIGHLLGAHHHYSNCTEGATPDDVTSGRPSSCTVMYNLLDFQSFTFGALESAVIRGHAVQFADSE